MSNSNIHPTAVIGKHTSLGKNVKIGPYCVIGENVKLGDNTVLHSHVVIDGLTEIGDFTQIFPFASIGYAPQDLKFKGEKSRLEIGQNNIIREHVTINPGTEGGGLLTKIGDNCLFMVGSHIAHDCKIGNNIILANNATLAGHVQVGDFAIIGGLSAIHQFVRIGNNAMIGGMSGIENDVIPYGQANGERATLNGLNLVGLRRKGFTKEEIQALRKAYQILFFQGGTFADRIEQTANIFSNNNIVMDVISFLQEDSSRAVCQPKKQEKNANTE